MNRRWAITSAALAGSALLLGSSTTRLPVLEDAQSVADSPDAVKVAPVASQPEELDDRIRLKSRIFRPAPGLQREAIAGNREPAETIHFIAQFHPVPTSIERKGYGSAGVRLVQSLGGGAYVAAAKVENLGQLRRLEHFRWAGPLRATYKLDAAVQDGQAPAYARTDDGRVALTVQVHRDLRIDDAVRVAKAHGGVVVGRTPLVPSVTALFPADSADEIAAEDVVQYVAPVDPPLEGHNDDAVSALFTDTVHAAPYNLDGTGVTVLEYDTGIANHSDYNARITQTDSDANVPTQSHSTHVAGTLLGDGANSDGNDSAGNPNGGTANQWTGVAPRANLATFGLLGSNNTTDVLYDSAGDMNADFTTGITDGVDLATMSLGNNTGANGLPCGQLGDYVNVSILIDQIVRGSIDGQELTWFESAGNERNQACAPADGFRTISTPAPAKNSIVVGATNSNDYSMTAFSSWGPTDDGRIRPDVVGPGCQSDGDTTITSTDFVDSIPPGATRGNGSLDPGEATNAYSAKCGTSMATPAVAGVGALITEQWQTLKGAGTRPLPHTMKALLAHTAIDLGNPGPDYTFGYGHVNALDAVDLVRSSSNLITVDQVDQGQADTWYFSTDASSAPRVTLAWSDPAAARLAARTLVNDVDLTVTAPDGTVHRPQVLDPANPANDSVEADDDLNVMEMVLGDAQAGTWTVQVSGTTIPQGPSTYTLITPHAASEDPPLPKPGDGGGGGGGAECDTDIALRYVAGGDAVTKGSKNDSEDQSESVRYSEQLLSEHLQPAPGPWCLYNTAKNPTTTDTYQDDGDPTQQSQAHSLRPRLITLTLGIQNDTIKNTITTCFKNVKDHDFIEANTCALGVLTNQSVWDKLRDDMSEILNKYKVQMDGNPNLIVAVTGYYNPYPRATSVLSEIPGFCAKLQDTIPTCTARWILLPPALVTLDQVIKKLNKTIEAVVAEFSTASQGRYYFVNPYEKFEKHCMQMEVEIKTKVYHPTNTVHQHDSKNDFGCDDPWIISDGKDGTKSPFLYLTPAVTGVLILATQTTKGMGVYPDEDGHDCIADLIYEADNGWGVLKNRLGIPEPAEEPCS